MTDGGRDLWCAVIRQAFADATTYPEAIRPDGREARRWLTEPSADFNEVCGLAGLEPDAVRAEAIERCAALDSKAEHLKRRRPPALAKRIEFNGLNLTISEWADHLGVKPQTVFSRFRLGWSKERILSKEVRKYTQDA